MMDYMCPVWKSIAAPNSGGCRCYDPRVSILLMVHLATLVKGIKRM